MRARRSLLSIAALMSAGVLLAAGGTTGASAEEAPPAALSPTVMTVDGNGTPGTVPFNAENVTDIWVTTDWQVEGWCQDSEITGNIFRGVPVVHGNVIGEITSLLFSDCLWTDLEIEINAEGSAGDFMVRGQPAQADDPIEITITGLDLHFYDGSGFCEFYASGSLDAILYPGPVDGHDAVLELVPAGFGPPLSGFDLDITTPMGLPTCGGIFAPGDVLGAWASPIGVPSRFGLTTVGPGAGAISHG